MKGGGHQMGRSPMLGVLLVLGWCFGYVLALPTQLLQDGSDGWEVWSGWEWVEAGLGLAALLCSVTVLFACVCCKPSRGFKELGSVSSRVEGSTATLNQHAGPREEFTMFPPACISQLSVSSSQINFEPLPDIRPRPGGNGERQITDKTLPASFRTHLSTGLPTDEWFAEPHQNFPRNQLQYVKEIGKGWFGHVLEGRATGIFSDHTKGESPITSTVTPTTSRRQTPVAVKVLREDATPTEQMYFLHELRPYRDLSHPNVLKVLAQCLETEPFLILLQLCPKGDLKAVVRNDKSLTEAGLLHMALDVAAGLLHMHSHSFIHTDLAARNCVVDEDYTVKIGDYGYNIDFYKNEYYCAGEVALPLRWCAPETLKCTDTTIETKQVTRAANVWSFGVIMWEIASRGEMPYANLDDDQVIQQVMVDQSTILEAPKTLQLHPSKMYNIMKLSWSSEPSRPTMAYIHSLLTHLWDNLSVTSQDSASMMDFEQRWDQLQQQRPLDHSIVHIENTPDLRFENDFSLSVPLGSQLAGAISPSLQNLHGSVEDLDAKMTAKFGSALPSWLGMEPGQPMDSLTREITDAILKLDDYLAGEKSEPSTSEPSPEKGGVSFKLGKDSFVSNPPDSKLVRASGLSMEEMNGHPSITRTLSDGEDEGFTMRLEQGEFTEMVRLKSQSVQDFMKLTVVDDGSDSDNASQRNSLAFESINKPLAQEKSFSSEGNIREALRDIKFMSEIERLQAEHKYSIITEASRENASSIEYRNNDLSLDKTVNGTEFHIDSEAGSTDKLAASVESVSSATFDEKNNSEEDPFLGKAISPASSEGRETNSMNREDNDQNSSDAEDYSLERKPLPASPDCVVSSREPKPVALPDIVVHDASVKLSTPSPPPVESPVKVIKSDQPKEFRFIFDEKDSYISEDTDLVKDQKSIDDSKCDSIVFSENIRNTEDRDRKGYIISDNERGINESIASVRSNDVIKDEVEEVSNFLDLGDEKMRKRLTSTPLKRDSVGNEDVVDETINSLCFSEETDENSTSCDGDKDLSSDVIAVDTDDLGNKQRFVFGYSNGKLEEENEEVIENEDENEMLNDEGKTVPSYKPEEIVKGEDVVIGALDDYSLDLFKAVKSTNDLQPQKVTEIRNNNSVDIQSEEGIDKKENYPVEIEYDLEQWDKFLGSTLTEEQGSSDSIFKENSNEGGSELNKNDLQSIFGCTFEKENSANDNSLGTPSQITPRKNLSYNSNVNNTFESSTCDEICEIMANGEDESVLDTTRPDVNIDLFFSSDSYLSGSHDVISSLPPQITGDDETDNVFSNDDLEISKCSNDSYMTAASKTDTSHMRISSDSSTIYATPEAYRDDVIKTSCSLESELTDGTENSPEMGRILEETLIDTPSDSFTYRRESSVDSPFERETYAKVCPSGQSSNHKGDANDRQHSDVRKEASSIISDHSNAIDSKEGRGQEVISSKPSSLPNEKIATQVSEKPVDAVDEKNDVHNISLQSKLKSGDCWSSQDSQDSAMENEEVTENGEFWQQQMVAWQEAAFQTRQLLQQAAGDGTTTAKLRDSREDLEASPRSDTSSSRSHYSSSDMLNVDDEGTYVSYNTTDDEEVLGYKQEDINALRAELSLKLGGHEDELLHLEPEEPEEISAIDRENVVINYRGMVTTTLSPIKEESFLEDGYSPTKKMHSRSNSDLDFIEDESIEFQEPSSRESSTRDCKGLDDTYSVTEAVNQHLINVNGPGLSELAFREDSEDETDVEATNSVSEKGVLSGSFCIVDRSQAAEPSTCASESEKESLNLENAQDSLILEDLDEEDGPSSIQVYNAGNSLEAEDFLVVDTETNRATIVEGGKPRPYLAFITDQEEQDDLTEVEAFAFEESDDVAPESIPSVGGSRFDEMRYREQFLSNNPSWEKAENLEAGAYEGDRESELEVGHGSGVLGSAEEVERRKETEESPQGIQVPHYHSYFTSALSTISHPNASIEEPPLFEQVEHISLPYDVNYPAAGEQLQSLDNLADEDGSEEFVTKDTCDEKEDKEMSAKYDETSDSPIKLNFLGRLYSDESEEKDGEKSTNTREAGEASILSESEEEDEDDRQVARPKTPEPGEINNMTSAQMLAAKDYQINEPEEIEEQIEVEAGYEEDSDDEDDGQAPTPGKLGQVKFRVTQESRYTPDWESDSDSDDDSSSTSGEFMWRGEEEEEGKEGKEETKKDADDQIQDEEVVSLQPGEPCQQSSYILDVIEEEPEDDHERDDDLDDDSHGSEESESGEEEFTPSKWNRDLTPSHSLLKSPQNRSSLKKSVRWKRQRHHRVYEYPPEPRSWEPTSTDSNQRRSWGRSSLDYLSLADWELGTDEFIADDGGDMEDYVYRKPSRPAPPPPIYSLGSVTYDDPSEGFLVDNGEFFIRSSGSPFTFTSSSFSASDFFPGSHSSDYDVIFGDTAHSTAIPTELTSSSVDENIEEVYHNNHHTQGTSELGHYPSPPVSTNSPSHRYPVDDGSEQSSPTNASLGQLRHTRDKLRLEIPSISLTDSASKSTTHTFGNIQSGLNNFNGQEISNSLNLSRTEPEVSEV